MKLLIYDKFFDSLIKLPRGTQQKVIEFQRKFRENSKSAAIHLEPISTFKDKQLRTARIDQKYRIILRAPETGDTYYLLWVDNHDEAMAWATNKIFQWNTNTQSIQLFTSPDVEQLVETDSQGSSQNETSFELFTDYTDKDLVKIGLPEVLIPSVRKVVDLDGLEALEKYLPADAFENLFYLADGANIENLIYEIEEGKVASTQFEDQLKSVNNQRSFIEFTDDSVFNEVLAGELNKWKFFLHPTQRKLVESDFNGPIKVTGGAGTGKTVAALHRLKYLVNASQDSRPVLFTTYTKALTSNLKDLVSDLGMDQYKVVVNNIDALSYDLAKSYRLIDDNTKVIGFSSVRSAEEIWDELLEKNLIEFDRDFIISEYNQVILHNNVKSLQEYLRTSRVGRGKAISRKQRQNLWSVFESYDKYKKESGYIDKEEIYNRLTDYLTENSIKPFAHCVADELQDFSNVELRFLRALIEEKKNDLFLVGDPLQQIYDRKIYFSKAGINIRGNRSKRLRINYRTSEEIKKLAFSVIQDIAFSDFDGEEESKNGYVSLFHGDVPTYQIFKSKDDEISYIKEKITELKSKDFLLSEVAICARTKDEIRGLKSALYKANIPWYDITSNEKAGDKTGVRLSTFHSMKGLEFKVIFLADVNNRTCPFLPYASVNWDEDRKKEHTQSEKSLMYVAISRAVQKVIITGTGQHSEVIRL
ncbi:UvrD-helicase domain-containing protein [Pontibacter oryzae]|uniref:DNA 3'-5' helicase n=1 Tax=Pontibacter oryzae TaxID=2304593 RepID=A0A399SGF9_9BACT|nr:UvrD-helicase domain-containing protein [Pontibacter oryzae]RIJ42670.1 DNA helicase [Pontibacter oryzae]